MERFSQYISRRLSTGCNLTDYKKLQLQLGIEVILHNILMIGTILVVSSFFGLLFETIIFFLVFGSIRMFTGGFHFKSSLACLLGTGTMVFIAHCISNSCYLNSYKGKLILLVSLFLIMIFAPQGTKVNPITNPKYKLKAIIIVLFWYSISMIIVSANNTIITAIMFQMVSLIVQTFINRFILDYQL